MNINRGDCKKTRFFTIVSLLLYYDFAKKYILSRKIEFGQTFIVRENPLSRRISF